MRRKVDKFSDCHPAVEEAFLWNKADPPLKFLLIPQVIETAQSHLTVVLANDAHKQAKSGCFPCSVMPEESRDLTRLDAKRDVIQLKSAKPCAQVVHDQRVLRNGSYSHDVSCH